MSARPLKLGTRRSPLAMAQAEEARDRLLAAHPGLRQLSQSMMFPNPCFAGEEVALSVAETAPGRLRMVASLCLSMRLTSTPLR